MRNVYMCDEIWQNVILLSPVTLPSPQIRNRCGGTILPEPYIYYLQNIRTSAERPLRVTWLLHGRMCWVCFTIILAVSAVSWIRQICTNHSKTIDARIRFVTMTREIYEGTAALWLKLNHAGALQWQHLACRSRFTRFLCGSRRSMN